MEVEKADFYVVRTVPSKEEKFVEAIYKVLSKKEDHGVRAVFSPETVKGYVFAEATSLTKLVDAMRAVPNNRGVIRNPVSPEELSKYFEKEGERIVVNERDTVEIVAGPFKGDQARVVRVVPGKEEIVIEPINVPVPIPITLSIDDIRVLKSKSDEE